MTEVDSTIINKLPAYKKCDYCLNGVCWFAAHISYEIQKGCGGVIRRCIFCGNKGHEYFMVDKYKQDLGFCTKCEDYAMNKIPLNLFDVYALLRHPNIGIELTNLRINLKTILLVLKRFEKDSERRFGKYLILDIIKYYLSIHQFKLSIGNCS